MYWTNFILFLCNLLIYKKGSICFNIQFFMDKMKKVKKKRKLALPNVDLNPRFLNKTFPPKIWILREIRSIELMVLKKSRLYVTGCPNRPNSKIHVLKCELYTNCKNSWGTHGAMKCLSQGSLMGNLVAGWPTFPQNKVSTSD